MNSILPSSTTRKLPPISEIGPLTKNQTIIKDVGYKTETVGTGNLDENGKSESEINKIAYNFNNTESSSETLDNLKEEDMTFDLFKTIFKFAISESQINDNVVSATIYIKDISHPDLIKYIDEQKQKYYFSPENICIEIHEDNYGKIDDSTINNLKELKKRGYKLSINDFCVNNNGNNVSFETLVTLLSNQIILEYVEINGKHLSQIFDGKISKEKIRELRLIIKFLKSQGIKIIGKGVGYIEEGIGSIKEEKVRSFKRANNIKSFQLHKEDNQVLQKINNGTPEDIMKNPEIPLSLKILSIVKQTNYQIKGVLAA